MPSEVTIRSNVVTRTPASARQKAPPARSFEKKKGFMAVICIRSSTHDWTWGSEPTSGWGLMTWGADASDLHPSLGISCILECARKLGNCSRLRTSSSHRQAMLGLIIHTSGTSLATLLICMLPNAALLWVKYYWIMTGPPTDSLRLYQSICITYLHLSLLFLLSEKKDSDR